MEIIFQDNITRKLNKLKRLSFEFKYKFDSKEDVSILLTHIDYFEKEFLEIIKLLPPKFNTQSNLQRHITWTKTYLKQGKPEFCTADVREICENDIEKFEESYFSFKNDLFLKNDISKKINELILTGHFDSAIRSSFIELTEFLRDHFNIKKEIDGKELVNHIFGKNGISAPSISSDKKESIRDFLCGLYGLYRNDYAHKTKMPTWDEASALIGAILLIIEDIKRMK